MKRILVLRPEPGAAETAARAVALGLEPVVAPIFEIRPLLWTPPDPARFDAAMITSANAVRHGGAGVRRYLHLPCYCVGEASAAAAAEAGFTVRTGPSDGAALAALMAENGIRSAFHPCGRDHVEVRRPGLDILHLPVYAAEPAAELSAAAEAALAAGAVALLHSPRAAALFARLVRTPRDKVRVAAISATAAEAAGGGWRSAEAADRPRDEALLELAVKLCQNKQE